MGIYMPRDAGKENQDVVLKNGLIVDGTGNKAVTANLLIRSGRIHRISAQAIRSSGVTIDCTGRVVAPGFIDAHSHLDWHLPLKGHDDLKYPFLAQGITTVVGGNCGWAPAGLRESTRWREQVVDNPISNGQLPVSWDTVEELFDRLQGSGMSHNLALLAGHGSSRVSIRGLDSSPLHPYESKELLGLLEIAMDQGARGVSVGLQLAPGLFAHPEELKEIASLVRHKGKILAIHPRTVSAAAPGHSVRSFSETCNIAALRETLNLARRTGVRLQVSHLAFLGPRTWRTAETALRLIDQALSDGLDVRFDACGVDAAVSRVSSMLSPWFLARGAAAFEDAEAVKKLRKEVRRAERQLGLLSLDIGVSDISNPDLLEYNDKSLAEISRLWRLSPSDALIEIARRSAGRARLLFRKMGNDRLLAELIRHRACLFMTGAAVERPHAENPAAFGGMVRVLQVAREQKLLPVEETVRRMTGATAERFDIRDRGLLKEGLAADIVVFDWDNVRDNSAAADGNRTPEGIDYVFVNGRKIIGAGKKESPLNAGVPVRSPRKIRTE
jgi:N-acyl-D-amino-acid deacylase